MFAPNKQFEITTIENIIKMVYLNQMTQFINQCFRITSLAIFSTIFTAFTPSFLFPMETNYPIAGKTAEEILLVIDMQPEFEAAFDIELQSAIIEEINSAINNGSIVIFMEYVGNSSTMSNLTAVTSNHKQTYFLKKNTDSAYKAVKNFLI